MGVKNERMLHLTLLLLLLSPPQAESFIFSAIMTAVSFAYQAYQVINDAHDTYKKFAPQTTLDDVLDQAKRVEEKVDQIGAQLSNQIGRAVDTIVTRIDDLNNIREGIGKLSTGVRRIDNLYRSFTLYTSKRIRLNNHTLQDYINQVTTVGALAPKDILSDIHDLLLPQSGLRESFLQYIMKNLPTDDSNLCGRTTPQGQVYQIFRLVMVNEIRAFTMMAFAYSMNQVFKCESFEGELDYAEYDLQTRSKDYFDIFSDIAERTVNSIRNCDPFDWIRGENYYEFERFSTTYIISAKAFFQYYSHCDPGCGASWRKRGTLKVDRCDKPYGCTEETRCRGVIDNCVVTKDSATVCELGPTGPRYQYYITSDGRQGNNTDGCSGEKNYIENQKNDCDVCACTCYEDNFESKSLRTFSSREQLSDVANGKVVAGVKLVVKENMVHIQIMEAKVLPEGRIQPASLAWKDLENIKFDEEQTKKTRNPVYTIDQDDGTQYTMKDKEDYISFTWDKHLINTDDLLVPASYVVTGVKFSRDEEDEDKMPVQIAIQASPYDYDTGKLMITDDNPSIWLTGADMAGTNSAYDEERAEFKIGGTQSPFSAHGVAVPRNSPNGYVEVTSTGGSGELLTIPLLDLQEVVGKPAFAAGGIGLYYRSISDEIAGFLAIRLFAIDAMKNMQITVLDKLDQFKEGVTEFKGCNNEISN